MATTKPLQALLDKAKADEERKKTEEEAKKEAMKSGGWSAYLDISRQYAGGLPTNSGQATSSPTGTYGSYVAGDAPSVTPEATPSVSPASASESQGAWKDPNKLIPDPIDPIEEERKAEEERRKKILQEKETSETSGQETSSPTGTYGSYVNGDTPPKTTMEYQVGRDEPVKENLPAQAGQPIEKETMELRGDPIVEFPMSASSSGSSSQAGGVTTIQTTPPLNSTGYQRPTSAWGDSIAPVDSYEEYLRKRDDKLFEMYNNQQTFYGEQERKALDAIEEQRQASITEAGKQKTMIDNAATEQKDAALAEADNQKNLLLTMSEEQKNAVYQFAEEQRISDMNYAAQQYQLLLNSINAQKESGMAMATEQRDLLLSMSEEQRNAIYAAAESQRVAAEQRADVERERGVVDARSSYEQNKSSYGAKAESMGRMGLSGSGYSDYLDSKAYAQQRAETQSANAKADAAKREARYTEDQARLKADSDHYQNKYNAEAQFSQNKYEVDTTYQNNLLGAQQGKAQAEHEAESTERETKLGADHAHMQNKFAAESGYSKSVFDAESAEREAKIQSGLSYSENLFNADSQARSDKLTAEQTADEGKFASLSSYYENLIANDDAIGLHRLKSEQKTEESEQKAEETESTNRQQQLQNKIEIKNNVTGSTTDEEIDDLVDAGYISAEDAEDIKKDRDKQIRTDIENTINSGNFSATQSILESSYKDGKISKSEYQKYYYDAVIKNIDGVSSVNDVYSMEGKLSKLLSQGKLTTADKNNALKYLYQRVGTSISDTAKYDVNIAGQTLKQGQLMKVTINGTTYDISTDISGTSGNFVDNNTSRILNGLSGNDPYNGVLASVGDTIYVYRTGLSNGSGWVKVNPSGKAVLNGTSKGFYEAFGIESAKVDTSSSNSTANNDAFQTIQNLIKEKGISSQRGLGSYLNQYPKFQQIYASLTEAEKASLTFG